MSKAALMRRYRQKLAALPPSGVGLCHPALLSVANAGVAAGVSAEQIYRDLHKQSGGLRPDHELWAAINKAQHQHVTGKRPPAPSPRLVFDAEKAFRELIAQGHGWGEDAIRERSPIRIDWPPEEDAVHVIEALYGVGEYLYVGESKEKAQLGVNIRPAGEWGQLFRAKGHQATGPHIIPNPLTGQPGPKSDGGSTLRGDSCVASFRYAVVEFDGIPREQQMGFWAAVKLPIVALIDSGGKSIHGWIRVRDVSSNEEWARVVEQHLFGMLKPLGVDGACRNESHLSRLPGHRRKETDRWQRLLYLCPEGKPVAA